MNIKKLTETICDILNETSNESEDSKITISWDKVKFQKFISYCDFFAQSLEGFISDNKINEFYSLLDELDSLRKNGK